MTAGAEKHLTSAERRWDTTDHMAITDAANRRASLAYSNNTTTNYAYDPASRLTGITHNSPGGIIEALSYQCDAAGNRTSLSRNNATASLLPNAVASATYDAANEQTALAGATLTYDANGNLTNDGVNTYQWDARNRLMDISGETTTAFTYDALGRRIHKSINSVASSFLYDGNDVAAEIGGGAVGANYLRSLNIDEPLIRQTSIGKEHYHADALGSSLALSNGQGASTTSYTYEPFGKTIVTGVSTNVFQYTGRESDGIDLYYYRNRYHSPRLQRFLSEDLIRWSENLFVYVGNRPTQFRDPLGFEPVNDLGGGMASIGVGTATLAAGGVQAYAASQVLNLAAAPISKYGFEFALHAAAASIYSASAAAISAGLGGYMVGNGVIMIFPAVGTYPGTLAYNLLNPSPSGKGRK